MGRVSRAAALRAMETAFDLGVTHFDVARSYGYGDAEAVVGAFAAGKRDRITIATKFGIRASGAARGLRWIKPAIRQIVRHVPYARSAIRATSGRTLIPGYYGLADARNSFEESLRQLKTDYADVLFVHDCSPTDQLSEELLEYLDGLVDAGKVRVWGFATRREWIEAVSERSSRRPMIIQCERNLLNHRPITQGPLLGTPAIFHSPFDGPNAVKALEIILTREPAWRNLENAAGGLVGASLISRLLLEGAFHLAAENPVLCSMFDPTHIRENVAALDKPVFTAEQITDILKHIGQP